MKVSAEIRYFWRGAAPGGLEEWFRSGEGQPFPAGGGESRLDEYLRDADQTELSVKRRGEELGVEVKGRFQVPICAAQVERRRRPARRDSEIAAAQDRIQPLDTKANLAEKYV